VALKTQEFSVRFIVLESDHLAIEFDPFLSKVELRIHLMFVKNFQELQLL